ncbi:intercellular adhesion molecule 5 isoform X3 [Alligator sinensis]|uniref:Intercellular adhesion molecule 5 isoform X3 n=1 Tax=Alligator sinensis TaxID=38654 RepID=A0A3Q0GNL9_ALLSI|nr:intercellular adhesion molecule 5 isoform X3 [Alligator sinensis]
MMHPRKYQDDVLHTCKGYDFPGPAWGAFEVDVWPVEAVVPFGGTLQLNCSTTCLDPSTRGSLETSLTKGQSKNGTGWVAMELVDVTEWESSPLCYFNCGGTKKTTAARISLYRVPEQVILELPPVLEEGKTYPVTCWVSNVAPMRNLTVTLHLGGKVLHANIQGDPRVGATNITATFNMTAQHGYHGQDIACHTELDLRPHGPLLKNTSAPINLSVYTFPAAPQLRAPHRVEADTEANVSCWASGIFPAVVAQVSLRLGNQSLEVSIATSGDMVTAQATVRFLEPGKQELHCTVSMGPVTRATEGRVDVYRFPAPILELSDPEPLVGTNVTLTCHSPATNPPGVWLQLHEAEQILASGSQPQLQLMVHKGDHGRQFMCDANLTVGSGTVVKRTSAQLTVRSPPELPEASCPSTLTWVEGTQRALHCVATGVPAPAVACSKDGMEQQVGTELQVTRDHAGTYICHASNALGTQNHNIMVHVEYPPQMDDAGCPPQRTWLEGQQQQLVCVADANPKANVVCSLDGQPYDITQKQGTMRGQAGIYQCRATNTHGSTARNVTVRVEYGPEMDDTSCPQNWTWVEGLEEALTCKAQGNPTPSITCSWNGQHQALEVPQLVTREQNRTYMCIAANHHGNVTRAVSVRVEYKPHMDELSCPSHQTWLEGTELALACKADGEPPAWVQCTQDGTMRTLTGYHNASRNDSGLYSCMATNSHGSAQRAVTVQVDYSPVVLALDVQPSPTVLQGSDFSIHCSAEGSPVPTYSWVLPVAPNLNYSADNSTVMILGAGAHNSGSYVCTVANSYGSHIRNITIQVARGWQYDLTVVAIVVVVVLALVGTGGFIYYLKTTACKKAPSEDVGVTAVSCLWGTWNKPRRELCRAGT